jgi:sugar transferase (PEP-CTERM/EpsH1 system associated)
VRDLIITDRIPYPVISGANLRIYNLLRRITREHEVWLATLVGTKEQAENIAHLREICSVVEAVDIRPTRALAQPLEGFRYMLTGKPPDLRFYYSVELANKIRHLITMMDFDIVHIELSHMGMYLDILPREMRNRTVWMLHDIDWKKFDQISQLESKPARKLRIWLHSRMMRWWEPRYAERFQRCITVSESDRTLLMDANPRIKVEVVPNGVDTNFYQPMSFKSTEIPVLLFVGDMSYLPCVDAMVYFCQEVLPLIRLEIPNVEMWIVGINPKPEVKQLEGNGIYVTGRVKDVRPYYEKSTVCVVPLRAGSGTRLKILEAMALKRPIVSTLIGCEGLDVINGEHLFIADRAEEFAEKTSYLLSNEKARQQIASQARELVVNHYDWDVIAKRLMKIYEEVRG